MASGIWLLLAEVGLVLGVLRVMSPAYASSRRNAHRIAVRATVSLDGVEGELVDISVGGAAVRFPSGSTPASSDVELSLPGATPVEMVVVRTVQEPSDQTEIVSLRVPDDDWVGFRTMSMWLFHTPPGAVDGIPRGVPAVAATRHQRSSRAFSTLITGE